MKSWLWVVLVFGLVLMLPANTVEARSPDAAKLLAKATPMPVEEPVVLKCPKCQNDMEEGFFLDIQGAANNEKGPTLWIQGPVQGSFWNGLKLGKRSRRRVEAYRCTNCGYLELYAR